ncbi:hypothetical protein E2C01_016992 [Portunus trituberculatus]|uniref:Uncharacterized protein n=1 Tax=Portunus trituberculatus TaxID=210409 RepID=A0A5B7DRR1_PORTR|nr:hypothetical protein [Portunus trituberculatus]
MVEKYKILHPPLIITSQFPCTHFNTQDMTATLPGMESGVPSLDTVNAASNSLVFYALKLYCQFVRKRKVKD